MSYKKQSDPPDLPARAAFRSVDGQRALTEYEKEQRALHKNRERLKAERLAREAAKSKESQ